MSRPIPINHRSWSEVNSRRVSQPGPHYIQIYTYTHTHPHTHLCLPLWPWVRGPLGPTTHTHTHTLHLLGPAVTSCQLHVFCAVCLVCACVGGWVCIKCCRKVTRLSWTMNREEESNEGPWRTFTCIQQMFKMLNPVHIKNNGWVVFIR